ncbi:rhomboid-domain-containing protein [Cystobasidium minutum MCA 4210]|uniref:rhomboid-domain-containing protein n=1 Tax=Cystobasidium minutum MCA 4210 TaxID=1397322 RepID=UPI0034D01669|eukprot:jgi/Rhomi1/196387/gm1.4601_g
MSKLAPKHTPHQQSSIRALSTGSSFAQVQSRWRSPIQHLRRNLSVWSVLKAARPNWYAGRSVETVRAGPIKKVQWWMDRKIPKSWLFYGIIVTNVLVFLGWQYAINSATRFRDFGPYVFMMQNFAASWANLVRPWTVITSCFSHMDTSHILVNLFSFYFMGQAAMSILSVSQFASLYMLAGLAGNAVQMLWHPVQGTGYNRQPAFALGASGAISGVLSFYAMAFPHHKLILFFVIPAPAWLAVSGIIAYDMYTAIAKPNGGIAAAAHLGGAGAGILYFLKLVGRRPF